MNMASRQQQRFLDVRSYASTLDDLGVAVPTEVSTHYDISITPVAGPPPGYRIEAAPKGSQAKDTGCSPVTIDQGGTRLPAGCW